MPSMFIIDGFGEFGENSAKVSS